MNKVLKFPTKNTHNAKNFSGAKEQTALFQVVAYQNGVFSTPIEARCWMGRTKYASKVHASIWVNTRETVAYASGVGVANGGGYHKVSWAISKAIASAGIELEKNIAGRGDEAILEALAAIATYLGYAMFTIVKN